MLEVRLASQQPPARHLAIAINCGCLEVQRPLLSITEPHIRMHQQRLLIRHTRLMLSQALLTGRCPL